MWERLVSKQTSFLRQIFCLREKARQKSFDEIQLQASYRFQAEDLENTGKADRCFLLRPKKMVLDEFFVLKTYSGIEPETITPMGGGNRIFLIECTSYL